MVLCNPIFFDCLTVILGWDNLYFVSNYTFEILLKRELGLLDGTMLVVGSMIGLGIFIVSSDMVRQLSLSVLGYLQDVLRSLLP